MLQTFSVQFGIKRVEYRSLNDALHKLAPGDSLNDSQWLTKRSSMIRECPLSKSLLNARRFMNCHSEGFCRPISVLNLAELRIKLSCSGKREKYSSSATIHQDDKTFKKNLSARCYLEILPLILPQSDFRGEWNRIVFEHFAEQLFRELLVDPCVERGRRIQKTIDMFEGKAKIKPI